MSVLLDAAQAYAALRWPVFPVREKLPLTPHGFHDARIDPCGVVALFRANPNADGIGVSTGPAHLVVLDLDEKPGLSGRDTMREAGFPWLEVDAPRARTPRGGEHIFFTGSTKSRNGALLGVDVKSLGGYVVLPPSPGRTWYVGTSPFELAPPPAPGWLLNLAGAPRAHRWEAALEGIVEEGGRNETAASIAGKLLSCGVPLRFSAMLVVAWARSFCRPPLEDAEALAVVRSIAAREGIAEEPGS